MSPRYALEWPSGSVRHLEALTDEDAASVAKLLGAEVVDPDRDEEV